MLDQPFAIGDLPALREALIRSSDPLLYLADNAGETVFDRVLLEFIDRPVIYAVRGAPVLNDVTRQDALAAADHALASAARSGEGAVGT